MRIVVDSYGEVLNDKEFEIDSTKFVLIKKSLLINKIKIYQLLDLAQGVIRSHPLLQTQPWIKHFKLSASGLSSHHVKGSVGSRRWTILP